MEIHTRVTPYHCKWCVTSFLTEFSFKRHIRFCPKNISNHPKQQDNIFMKSTSCLNYDKILEDNISSFSEEIIGGNEAEVSNTVINMEHMAEITDTVTEEEIIGKNKNIDNLPHLKTKILEDKNDILSTEQRFGCEIGNIIKKIDNNIDKTSLTNRMKLHTGEMQMGRGQRKYRIVPLIFSPNHSFW